MGQPADKIKIRQIRISRAAGFWLLYCPVGTVREQSREKMAGKGRSARPEKTAAQLAAAASHLLDWYDRAGRQLPWRRHWPELAPPYLVFLSELMLQQTTVTAVIPYFQAFVRRWPTIEALADADQAEVLEAWAGLGYYARARNMHKAARLIVARHEGRFPEQPEQLCALPGIGPYTAGAIAAIAFDQPAPVIDGNIERVLARFYHLDTPLPALKKQLVTPYSRLLPDQRRSDFPQALMDLGALICTPARPDCAVCPLARDCSARQLADPSILPVKPAKKAKPTRQGRALVLLDGQGRAALIRRAGKGLLGGLPGFPSDGWDRSPPEPLDRILEGLEARILPAKVRHTFTHFHASMTLCLAEAGGADLPAGWFWAVPEETGLPSLMKKIWQASQTGQISD